jgi:ribonucleotide monophosphatase NagD (HAD superfamily)
MYFVTNNSTKSRKGYKKKFDSLGLDVPAEEIFSSSFAAAAYLEQTNFKASGKKVYVVGEVGIQEELDLIGVPHFGGPEDAGKQPDMGPGCALPHDHDVGAVIVGFDRNINYYKIQYAQLCINENPGCEFIATNTDAVTHLTDAQEWAGNGSMVGAIKGCTGQEVSERGGEMHRRRRKCACVVLSFVNFLQCYCFALFCLLTHNEYPSLRLSQQPTVVGKPSPLMIDYLCNKLGLDRGRICMVGDRLDTDILFGTDNGLKSLLVLSGVTTEEKLLSQENTITPDYYADSIVDFFVDETAKVEATA